ncbi:MAG: serine/threonine-protein kinase [Phycisphaerae bacterium]|nr:serine/threonine-protein kinase [Phycisphaerae bacterium]
MPEPAHEDVRRLFDLALDLPAAQRETMLDHACAGDEGLKRRILAMIATAEDDQFLSNATADKPRDPTASDATIAIIPAAVVEQRGQEIGRYKLLEQIGEGGFGSVWAAEQREPVKRRVALKIIKLGMDTKQVIARFEAERQALAMMDHPNIAKVLDAGSTESGRPFFVMELVKGVPILDYCDTEKLDTRQRLDIFTKVCKAIQHAHQKGIIHRDIKPSNVLITLHDGIPVPKVIDFGIVKATNQELTTSTIYTEHRQIIGTPAYMSPEQAEMSGLDIDTRSDIYSLGVLLYEMLTGTTPFTQEELASAGFDGMMRMIREVEPQKPSTRLSSLGETATQTAQRRRADVGQLGLMLQGDLDWIVMKCLEKDRTRRYETANSLAADIARHLNDEPVVAGPPSARYKLRKFVRRYRAQVITGGVVAVALVLGAAGASTGLVWALTERDRANEQATIANAAAVAARRAQIESQQSEQRAVVAAERAAAAEAVAQARAHELEEVAAFQSEQLAAIEPEVMGVRLRRALLDAVPKESRGELSATLASVNFTSIALGTLRENIFDRTIAAIDSQFAKQPLVRARLLQTVADSLLQLGLFDLATGPQSNALAIRRMHLGEDDPDTLTSLDGMGLLMVSQGKPDDAEMHIRVALETSRRVLGEDHIATLRRMNNMGGLLEARGKFVEAEAYHRQALEASRRVLGDDHEFTLTCVSGMGHLLWRQGKHDEAEPYHRAALAARRRVLGDDHSDTLTSINNTAALLFSQGKLDEAETHWRESLAGIRRMLGDDHPHTLASLNNLAGLLSKRGKLAEAESMYREALSGLRRVLGNDHPHTLTTIGNLSKLLHLQGNPAEAELYAREELGGRMRVLGDEHPETMKSIEALRNLLECQGKAFEMEPYYLQALEFRRRMFGDDHADTLRILDELGDLLGSEGRLAEAEGYFREALGIRRRMLGDRHAETLASVNDVGVVVKRQGKLAESEAYFREVLEGRRQSLGNGNRRTLAAMGNLALLLADLERGAECLRLVDEAIEHGKPALAEDDWYMGHFLCLRGRALQLLGRYDDAANAMLEGHNIHAAALGDAHERTQRVIGYLADLFDEWRRAKPDVDPRTLNSAAWALLGLEGDEARDLQRGPSAADGAHAVEAATKKVTPPSRDTSIPPQPHTDDNSRESQARATSVMPMASVLGAAPTRTTDEPKVASQHATTDSQQLLRRGDRYGEVLLVRRKGLAAEAEVWGTQGVSEFAAKRWKMLDAEKIRAQTGAYRVILNGPRVWLPNATTGAQHSKKRAMFGELELGLVTTLNVERGQNATSYRERTAPRTAIFTFNRGEEVYELESPDGVVYVMQSMSQTVDSDLMLDQLPTLGARLSLPRGWTYRARELEADLILAIESEAAVLQDDLKNTYLRR